MAASLGKVEALLRACAVLMLVLTACLVGMDTQTKAIVFTYKKKVTYKYLNALTAMVYIDVAAAAYSLLQLSRCTISVWSHKNLITYDQKNLAWGFFLLDQVVVYAVFAVNSAAAQAALLAVTGSKGLQWMKWCNRFTRFCIQIGGSLFCGYVTCFLLATVSFNSAFNLFRLYSPTQFMQLKRKT
ncbi:hypothetical protein CDL15_Pgr027113 [Punica granatum]|uniref:CASP-like protein n=1 Tax=Punica granatum TaxID=22663 RepID=A0A218XHD9_PUNGR|nr:hypothetical protein CDL15_Pgr027113 [Punica granatum]